VDRIRDLGWAGVAGNTDELLFRPESLREFAQHATALQPLVGVIEEMAAATREKLGEQRLAWLRELPQVQQHGSMMLVHASPGDLWRAPEAEASDAELESIYAPLRRPVVFYAHIHHPYIRSIPGGIVANTGSVSLSYDGDPRASYLLLDDSIPSIRRVAYDMGKELDALSKSGLSHKEWLAKTLESARPQMPPPKMI
jgi:diadenosine tetraphosphatase ApaH/serine/threonine PP2A family protein phosphatase